MIDPFMLFEILLLDVAKFNPLNNYSSGILKITCYLSKCDWFRAVFNGLENREFRENRRLSPQL